MAIPAYVAQLREKIGNDPLHLPGVTAVVLRESTTGAFLDAPEVLLVKRADTHAWTPVTGIIEPGEDAGEAAVREVQEETTLEACVAALIGTGATGLVTHTNGDQVYYHDTALRLEVVGAANARVGDDESEDVRWFPVVQLPPSVTPRFRLIIADAVAQRKNPAGFRPRVGYRKRS